VDLSGELQERQRATIEADAPELASKVRWLSALPAHFEGVVIGNEVLDAMPVRLVVRKLGVWHERGVSWTNNRFAFDDKPLLAALDDPLLAEIDATIDEVNDEPFIEYLSETHEAALAFTRTICTMLTRGAAFFIDYGFPAARVLSRPARARHAHVPLPASGRTAIRSCIPGCRTSRRTWSFRGSRRPARTRAPTCSALRRRRVS
jgi:SAM-dependent MidA family methyltransferase